MNMEETILQSITQLNAFPAVIHRALQLINDSKASAQDVVEVIQYDQSITAHVLMVCNSAFFGSRRPVSSIRDALVRIGFNQFMEIILGRWGSSVINRSCPGYDLTAGELWRHSVACALLSQIIAERLKWSKSPIHFSAALVHDIGKVVLNEFVKEHFEEIKKLVQEKKVSFLEAEKEVLSLDHAEIGGKISERWKFPSNMVSAIRYHHTPFSSPADQDLVSLIYLCDVVAMMTGFGGGADGLSYHAHKEVMKKFRLKEKDLEWIITQLEEELKKVESLLDIKV